MAEVECHISEMRVLPSGAELCRGLRLPVDIRPMNENGRRMNPVAYAFIVTADHKHIIFFDTWKDNPDLNNTFLHEYRHAWQAEKYAAKYNITPREFFMKFYYPHKGKGRYNENNPFEIDAVRFALNNSHIQAVV